MNKLSLKIWKDRSGTALLVALLVMGVLIAISLALSSLILRESGAVRELIDAGRAYYAAESGIEQALYKLDTSLPGWEGMDANLGKVGENAVFSYEVKNKCNSYPCFDVDEYDTASMSAYNFYDILQLNESITIPLFTVDEGGNVNSVEDFTVEFFMAFNPATDLIFSGSVSGWDVLRWKVFGLRDVEGSLVTESIHDFTAVSSAVNTYTGEEFVSNAENPSWFGTMACNSSVGGIVCSNYTPSYGACTHMQARDYYLYDGGEFQAKLPCFDIETFLDMNQAGMDGATGLNYLSLTNLMNPAMLKPYSELGPRDPIEASDIYFRVETYEDDTVREFARITSDGFSGDSKQSISVNIKRDSYMPVFNFSIYSTHGSEDGFYTENDPKPELPE